MSIYVCISSTVASTVLHSYLPYFWEGTALSIHAFGRGCMLYAQLFFYHPALLCHSILLGKTMLPLFTPLGGVWFYIHIYIYVYIFFSFKNFSYHPSLLCRSLLLGQTFLLSSYIALSFHTTREAWVGGCGGTGTQLIDRVWGHFKTYVPNSIHAKTSDGLSPQIMKYAWSYQFRRNCGKKLWKIMGKKCLKIWPAAALFGGEKQSCRIQRSFVHTHTNLFLFWLVTDKMCRPCSAKKAWIDSPIHTKDELVQHEKHYRLMVRMIKNHPFVDSKDEAAGNIKHATRYSTAFHIK